MKSTILFYLILTSAEVFAHCPTSFKQEKVCLMLDKNIIYVYDELGKHDGPYKDLTKSTILNMKSAEKLLPFKKVARGIYKIDSTIPLIKLSLQVMNGNKLIELKISGE